MQQSNFHRNALASALALALFAPFATLAQDVADPIARHVELLGELSRAQAERQQIFLAQDFAGMGPDPGHGVLLEIRSFSILLSLWSARVAVAGAGCRFRRKEI